MGLRRFVPPNQAAPSLPDKELFRNRLELGQGDVVDAIHDFLLGQQTVPIQERLSPADKVLESVFFGQKQATDELFLGDFEFTGTRATKARVAEDTVDFGPDFGGLTCIARKLDAPHARIRIRRVMGIDIVNQGGFFT